jgi:hypothetical protein
MAMQVEKTTAAPMPEIRCIGSMAASLNRSLTRDGFVGESYGILIGRTANALCGSPLTQRTTQPGAAGSQGMEWAHGPAPGAVR